MFIILNFPKNTRRNSIENVGYRNTYITGEVKEDMGGGKYKVEIAGGGEDYPNIYTIYTDPDYVVGEKVGILWEYGNREKPVIAGILRNITFREVSGSVNSLGS